MNDEIKSEIPTNTPTEPVVIVMEASSARPCNYLTWSVLNTICCCSIFGILATIYSVKTRESIRYNLSQQEIRAYSARALCFNLLSLLFGLITLFAYFYINIYLKSRVDD